MTTVSFDQLHLFEDLSEEQLCQLRSLFIYCQGEPGEVIFAQGAPAEFLYVVVEGEVVVRYKPFDGPPMVVARVGPQGVVGWSAALGSKTYTSEAVCAGSCQMLRVRSLDLQTLCHQHRDTGALVLERLAAVIAERLRNTHTQVVAMLEQGLRVKA